MFYIIRRFLPKILVLKISDIISRFESKEESYTFIRLIDSEKGLPHSFFSEQEVLKMFQNFSDIRMGKDQIDRWMIRAEK